MDTTAAAELLMAGGTAPSDHGRPPFWVDAADRHPSWEEDQGEPLHSPALAHNFNRYDGFGVDAGGRGTSSGSRGLGPSGPGPPLKRMRANHMGLGIEGLEQGYQGPPGGYGREGIGGGYGEGVSEVNGLHGGIGPRGPVGMPAGIGMQQRTSNGMQGGGQGFGPGSFSPGPGQPDASPLGGGARIGGAAGGGSGSGVANTGGGRGRGMGSIFFKTKLCCRFRAGNCPYNTNCNFAHGMEELRKPPRGWEEMVANQEAGCTPSYQIQGQGMGQGGQGQVSNQLGQQSDAQKFHKTRPCKKYFSDGGCPYGDRCNFLHDEPGTQARSVRETSALSSGPLSPGGASSGSGGVTARPPNWKTRLCNKWEVTGHCPFGEKCHFAHGTAELQSYGGGPFDSSNGGSGGGTPTEVKSSTKQWEVGLTDPQPTGTSTLQGLALKQARCGARLVHAAAAHHRADAQWKESWSEISTVYGDWIEDDQIKLWNEAEKVYSQKRSEYAGQELPARRDKGDGGQYYGPESDPYLRADTGQNCIPQRRLNGQHIGYHGVMAGVHSLHSQNQVDYGYYGQEGSNYDGL